MRLIDADALKANEKHYDEEGVRIFYESEIDNAPTVDTGDVKYLEERDADAYETGYLQGHVDGYLKAEKDYAKPLGKWEEPFERNGKTYHKCNHCHISSQLILIDNFCPNCGAQMQKGGAE